MNLSTNENKTDRTIRVAAGIVILAAGLVLGSWWGLIGLIPLVTGMAGWCPLYALFGFSTAHHARGRFQPGSGAL